MHGSIIPRWTKVAMRTHPFSLCVIPVAALLLGAQAPASVPPDIAPDDGPSVETISVTASSRGPAFWRITRGNAEVLILPTVGLMPEDMSWNKQSLERFIAGARQVMLPPQPDLNLLDIGWFYVWNGDLIRQPRGQTLEGSMPDSLRARFVAARKLAERDADRYAGDVPAIAAIRLTGDFSRARDLTRREPRRTVERLAREARVKITNVGTFEVVPTVRELLRLPHDKQRICLEQAVTDTERLARDVDEASSAWADGRILEAQAHYSETRLVDCAISLAPRAGNVEVSVNTLLANAIDAALRSPGKSVAVIPLGPLVRRGGVLEQLAAKGHTIHHPEALAAAR
jgi:hypothetical protein